MESKDAWINRLASYCKFVGINDPVSVGKLSDAILVLSQREKLRDFAWADSIFPGWKQITSFVAAEKPRYPEFWDYYNYRFELQGETMDLPVNSYEGTVTGLALAAAPRSVVLNVQIPDGGYTIMACLVGAPTADGFKYRLSGRVPDIGYKLHYDFLV